MMLSGPIIRDIVLEPGEPSELLKMMLRGITGVIVDHEGRDASGERFDTEVTPEGIAAGIATNTPVIPKFPDGTLSLGNWVGFTKEGIETLRQLFALDDAPPAGRG